MKEKTVNFDSYNSLDDLGIIFRSLSISSPEAQLNYVDVPYRNGQLDLSDFYGTTKYKTRDLSFEFIIPWTSNDQLKIYSNVLNKINGKRMNITLSADDSWHYEGRIMVGDLTMENGMWTFDAKAEVDPYKYKNAEYNYVITEMAANPRITTITNSSLNVIPTITTNAPIQIIFPIRETQLAEDVYNFSTGTFRNTSFIFTEGSNAMKIGINNGTGESYSRADVTISFKEGSL